MTSASMRASRRHTRSLAIALCAILLVAPCLISAPAHASRTVITLVKTDPRHDVNAAGGPTPAQRAQADIVKVYLGRGAQRVWVRFVTRGMSKKLLKRTVYSVRLIQLHSKSRNPEYDIENLGRDVDMQSSNGTHRCHAKAIRKVDLAHHTVQFSVPRWCFPRHWTATAASLSTGEALGTRWASDGVAMRGICFLPRP